MIYDFTGSKQQQRNLDLSKRYKQLSGAHAIKQLWP